MSPAYRKDIDGLRAVAVLSVVGFHAFPLWIKGGFIGVDVFFVISGFLISTIIFTNLQNGTFTFSGFYRRRIRRIFPALALVLAFCFAVGWFWLLADEFRQLGKHIASGAGMVSNFVLWGEAGYFDKSAETKPLLHLWSLGIEEQFYIIWPFLVWLLWKTKIKLMRPMLAIACGSLAFSISAGKIAGSDFYSPLSRFWELMAGSLLALHALNGAAMAAGNPDVLRAPEMRSFPLSFAAIRSRLPDIYAFAGICLLGCGYALITKASVFPGKWALLPVMGAVLILTAGPAAWFNRVILSNRLLVWVGLLSYPLYLWHWPLLSFARIIGGETPSASVRVSLIVVSFVLAWMTYIFVERPLRFGIRGGLKVVTLLTTMAILGFAGWIVYVQEGYPLRAFNQKFASFSQSIKTTDRAKECFEIPYAYNRADDWYCVLGAPDSVRSYFAYGDSHALSFLPALEKYAHVKNLGIEFTGTSGCPPLLGIQSMRGKKGIEKYNCRLLNERVFSHVKSNHIKNVILIARWVYYTGSISRPAEFNAIARDELQKTSKASSSADFAWAVRNTVARYGSIGVNVIFVADNPQQIREPKDILRLGKGVERKYNEFSVSAAEHVKNQQFVNGLLSAQNAQILNFDSILCGEQNCPLVRDSRFIYSDDDHLSVYGSLGIYPSLERQLR